MTDFTSRCISTAFQRSDASYQRFERARDQWLIDHPGHSADEYLAALREIMLDLIHQPAKDKDSLSFSACGRRAKGLCL